MAALTVQSTHISADLTLRVKVKSDEYGTMAATATIVNLDWILALLALVLDLAYYSLFQITWQAKRATMALRRATMVLRDTLSRMAGGAVDAMIFRPAPVFVFA